MIRLHAPIGHAPSRQRGAVLVISLLILLIMTLIGITGMQTSVLEERMAGNYRDIALAFQASETALRDAESRIRDSIDGLTGFSDDCGSDGLCDATSGLSEVWEDHTGVPLGTDTDTDADALELVEDPPIYWIEGYKVRPPGSPVWKSQYRITAVGYGTHDTTQVLLQSVYAP